MKILVSALTAAVLLAGVGAANAIDQQTTGVEIDNALSHEVASPAAYASARLPGRAVVSPTDFQAQGSH
jgi:homoaconitase/3-isopropylmalate dehydratase large subunit